MGNELSSFLSPFDLTCQHLRSRVVSGRQIQLETGGGGCGGVDSPLVQHLKP